MTLYELCNEMASRTQVNVVIAIGINDTVKPDFSLSLAAEGVDLLDDVMEKLKVNVICAEAQDIIRVCCEPIEAEYAGKEAAKLWNRRAGND